MDHPLNAFFREAQDISIGSVDKAQIRDTLSKAIRYIIPQASFQPVPVRVAAAASAL